MVRSVITLSVFGFWLVTSLSPYYIFVPNLEKCSSDLSRFMVPSDILLELKPEAFLVKVGKLIFSLTPVIDIWGTSYGYFRGRVDFELVGLMWCVYGESTSLRASSAFCSRSFFNLSDVFISIALELLDKVWLDYSLRMFLVV